MADEPETPAEELPQDPGTSGLPAQREQPPGSAERPTAEEEKTGTDAARRPPRHRSNEAG